jgi:hypothetical protein
MPTKLARLNSQLSASCRRRWLARVIEGCLVLALALLVALVVDFLGDWTLRFNFGQRAFILAVFLLLAIAGLRRFVWPAVNSRETVIDRALAVERRRGIDSDLVAALQFESTAARTWGSSQLQAAVVDAVAGFGDGPLFDADPSERILHRKTIPLAIASGIILCAAASFPAHTTAFVDRFLLGSARYPTQTTITRIVINGKEAFPKSPPGGATNIPFGPPIKFEIESTGVAPESGDVRVTSQAEGATTIVMLAPVLAPGLAKSQGNGMYSGELPRLAETVSYQVNLGDAWTEPGTIRVIPAPVVSLELDHTPPAYAAKSQASRRGAGSRQISVLEGSQVSLTVKCTNKALAKADLIVGSQRFPLASHDDGKRIWKLDGETPLVRITAAVSFEVDVVDVDGLAPDQPLHGYIHIEADRPPRVAGAVVTERVLPVARPVITWGAADDNGIAEIRLLKQVTRAGGQVEESQEIVRKVPTKEQPQPVLRGRHTLDLKPLGLAKGDELRVTLEAVDFRGDLPGASARSDGIVFTVTDETGILAGLIEADEKSARQLDQIIQRQLGIGEGR